MPCCHASRASFWSQLSRPSFAPRPPSLNALVASAEFRHVLPVPRQGKLLWRRDRARAGIRASVWVGDSRGKGDRLLPGCSGLKRPAEDGRDCQPQTLEGKSMRLPQINFGFHRHGNCWRFWSLPQVCRYRSGRQIWLSWWRFFVSVESFA